MNAELIGMRAESIYQINQQRVVNNCPLLNKVTQMLPMPLNLLSYLNIQLYSIWQKYYNVSKDGQMDTVLLCSPRCYWPVRTLLPQLFKCRDYRRFPQPGLKYHHLPVQFTAGHLGWFSLLYFYGSRNFFGQILKRSRRLKPFTAFWKIIEIYILSNRLIGKCTN